LVTFLENFLNLLINLVLEFIGHHANKFFLPLAVSETNHGDILFHAKLLNIAIGQLCSPVKITGTSGGEILLAHEDFFSRPSTHRNIDLRLRKKITIMVFLVME